MSSDTHEYSYLSVPLAPGRHEFRLIQVSTDGREKSWSRDRDMISIGYAEYS